MVRPVVYFMILVIYCGVLSNGARISTKPKESLPRINFANSTVGQLYVINYYDSSSVPTTLKGLDPIQNGDTKTEGLDCNVIMERNKQLQRSTTDMKEKIKDLEKEVELLKEKVTSKERRIIKLEKRIDSKEARISEMQKTIDTLQKGDTLKDLQTMVKHLQETVVGRCTTIKDLEKTLVKKDAADALIKNLTETVEENEATIRELKKTIVQRVVSIRNLQNNVDGKETTIKKQTRKIAHLKKAITKHCVVDGGWSKWSEWRKCNATCGDGVSIRARSCLQRLIGGSPCQGNKTDERAWNNKCPVNLAIIFRPWKFKLRPPHKVQGNYGIWKITFVNDTGLGESPTFLEVKEFLASVFSDAGKIRLISQWWGYSKDGKKAIWVTTVDGFVTWGRNALIWCDADGKRYRGSELERRSNYDFRKNDRKRLSLARGDCRTVMFIYAQ